MQACDGGKNLSNVLLNTCGVHFDIVRNRSVKTMLPLDSSDFYSN